MKNLKILVSFVILLLTLSCGNDDDNLNIIALNSKVLISAEETTSGNIILYCETAEDYSCANYEISKSTDINQNAAEISFNGVFIEGEMCATALGPATTTINLGNWEIGEYPLRFGTPNTQDNGQLTITQTQIKFEFETQEGIEILTPVIER